MKTIDLVIVLLAFAALLVVSALLNFFLIFVGVAFLFVLLFLLREIRVDIFKGVSVSGPQRFELRKGQSRFIKGHDVRVEYIKLLAPKPSVDAHTPKMLKLMVEDGKGRTKVLTFDVNNKNSVRDQKAFGKNFHFLDHKNNRALLSVT